MSYDWGTHLFSSPHRLEILQTLRSSAADTRELTNDLSASRVTVQRHLNLFVDLEWIEKTNGRYELTPVGEHVYHATTDFHERLSLLERRGEVVSALAGLEDGFDPTLLTDATISVAETTVPHEPITHYRNAMSERSPESIRGILPVFSELLTEIHGDLLADGVETELIVPPSVLETAPPSLEDIPLSLFSLRILEESGTKLNGEPAGETPESDADVDAASEHLEFAVTLTDDTAFVGGYVDGSFVTCVENDSPAFYDWVTDLYETYRDRSSAIPLEEAAEYGTGGTES